MTHTVTHTPVIGEGKSLAGASLFAVGVYLLLPTPDEAFVHPLFGSLLSRIFGVSFKEGVGISVATYTAIGIILCLIGSGKQIYQSLKTRFPKRYKTLEIEAYLTSSRQRSRP